MPKFSDPEQICEQILEAVGHTCPPTDLEAVCSLWPDLKVEEEDLDKEGYLIPLGVHGAEILLRRDDPPNRKKFTLAHELGHWAQAHLKSGLLSLDKTDAQHISFRTHHKRQTPEEIWCNKFAACLLMPSGDVNRYLWNSSEVNLADCISRGHSVFQVSQEAFLNRVRDITPINVFEVVVADTSARIRRRFLSNYNRDDQVETMMDTFINSLCDEYTSFNGLLVDNYSIQTHVTHSSQYSRTWLVSVLPIPTAAN